MVDVEGRSMGLIGYITDLTPTITSADLASLTFEDVSQSQLRSSLSQTARRWRA